MYVRSYTTVEMKVISLEDDEKNKDSKGHDNVGEKYNNKIQKE